MDIAVQWDVNNWRGDFAIGLRGDLVADNGLLTALLISTFTDRLAASDDALPDPADGDRRGWWGDLPIAASSSPGPNDLIGSRLWLLARAKQTNETLARARDYLLEAYQWLIDDEIAAAVDVAPQWQGIGFMAIRITVSRIGADGVAVDHRFDLLWNMTLSG